MQKMKKLLAVFLSGMALMSSVSLVGCGKEKHTHQYVEASVPATCLKEGYNIFLCDCGDSYKGEKVLPKTAHTGMVSCEVCGLNYFDEIKALVIENGKLRNEEYTYYGETRFLESGTSVSTWVSYNPETMGLCFQLLYFQSDFAIVFSIEMLHPSEDDSLQTGNYKWKFISEGDAAYGIINGNTFSSATEELPISTNIGFASSQLEAVRVLSATFADIIIKNTLIPLLRLGKNDVTPKNLGFVNYTL